MTIPQTYSAQAHPGEDYTRGQPRCPVGSNVPVNAAAEEPGGVTGQGGGVRTHSPELRRRYLFVLALVTVLFAGAYPLLTRSDYEGSPDLRAVITMAGALPAVIVGVALCVRASAAGSRFHLFAGLAYFVNGAEDLVHGILSFANILALPALYLAQLTAGTYVTGRPLVGVILLLAPFASTWFRQSANPRREGKWICLIVGTVGVSLTICALQIPLPELVYADGPVSRPVDLLSATVLGAALRFRSTVQLEPVSEPIMKIVEEDERALVPGELSRPPVNMWLRL